MKGCLTKSREGRLHVCSVEGQIAGIIRSCCCYPPSTLAAWCSLVPFRPPGGNISLWMSVIREPSRPPQVDSIIPKPCVWCDKRHRREQHPTVRTTCTSKTRDDQPCTWFCSVIPCGVPSQNQSGWNTRIFQSFALQRRTQHSFLCRSRIYVILSVFARGGFLISLVRQIQP